MCAVSDSRNTSGIVIFVFFGGIDVSLEAFCSRFEGTAGHDASWLIRLRAERT
tara:strand:+ start:462 stop:620 length:159 start_codon:yes stop_codon:yes gene_type:complete